MESYAPNQLSPTLDPMANFSEIDALNEQITNQNDRVPLFNEINDMDFKKVAEAGLIAEQSQTMTALADLTARTPYAELGEQSLIASHEIGRLATVLAGVDEEINGIKRLTALTVQVAPATSEAAAELAAAKIAEITDKHDATRAHMNKLIQANDQLFALAGEAWPVPIVASSLQPNIVVAPVVPQDAPAEAEGIMTTFVNEEISTDDTALDASKTMNVRGDKLEIIVERVLWSVYEYAETHPWMSMEEARDAVPELSQLTKAEYVYFRSSFQKVRQQIISKLAERGVEASWEVTGITRDKRYNLIFKENKLLVNAEESGSSPKESLRLNYPAETSVGEANETPDIHESDTQSETHLHSASKSVEESDSEPNKFDSNEPANNIDECEILAQVEADVEVAKNIFNLLPTLKCAEPHRVERRYVFEDVVNALRDMKLDESVANSCLLRLVEANIFDAKTIRIKKGITRFSRTTIGFVSDTLTRLAKDDINGLMKQTEESLLQQAINKTLTFGQE